VELGAAQLGQRVDALAEVDGFHRRQNPHLRRDRQHAYDAGITMTIVTLESE
jgi:hypothetical protein